MDRSLVMDSMDILTVVIGSPRAGVDVDVVGVEAERSGFDGVADLENVTISGRICIESSHRVARFGRICIKYLVTLLFTCPSNMRMPPIWALKARPTAQIELLGEAAT